MSDRVASIAVIIAPDHGTFGIADSAADVSNTPPPVGDNIFSANTSEVLIRVAQELLEPALSLELWDSAPENYKATSDAVGAFTLEIPSGVIAVNQIAAGWVPRVFNVPPDTYNLRITGHNLHRTRTYANDRYQRFRDWDDPDFTEARHSLRGLEHYIAQIWPTSSTDDPRSARRTRPSCSPFSAG